MVVPKKAEKAPSGFIRSLRSRARPERRWPWPRAALIILLLSLVLWGAVAAIALFAFN